MAGGDAVAVLNVQRKVRTPQGVMVANGDPS